MNLSGDGFTDLCGSIRACLVYARCELFQLVLSKPFSIVLLPNFVSLSNFSSGSGSRVVILYLNVIVLKLGWFSMDENTYNKGVQLVSSFAKETIMERR